MTPDTITVTLNREDANRIFQAMVREQARLAATYYAFDHARDLAEKSRQWVISLTDPIEGTDL